MKAMIRTILMIILSDFFVIFLPFLKDSKIDLLDSASAVKKKLNKVSFNSTCSFIYFFT